MRRDVPVRQFSHIANLHSLRRNTKASNFVLVKAPAELTAMFRASGLKVTPQRQLLFRLMHENKSHPTAESLFSVASDHMPGISLRTVYQTLTDLSSMGELRLIDVGSGAARFDPNLDDHHHLVCQSCGDVRDVYVSGSGQLDVNELDGFSVDTTTILFHGLCTSCRVTQKVSSTVAKPLVGISKSNTSSKNTTNPKERMS